jgi:hypothetical protein
VNICCAELTPSFQPWAKKLYDERLQARQTVLEKRGMASNDFKKDKVYQQLKAKHQAITKAIAAIDAALGAESSAD